MNRRAGKEHPFRYRVMEPDQFRVHGPGLERHNNGDIIEDIPSGKDFATKEAAVEFAELLDHAYSHGFEYGFGCGVLAHSAMLAEREAQARYAELIDSKRSVDVLTAKRKRRP